MRQHSLRCRRMRDSVGTWMCRSIPSHASVTFAKIQRNRIQQHRFQGFSINRDLMFDISFLIQQLIVICSRIHTIQSQSGSGIEYCEAQRSNRYALRPLWKLMNFYQLFHGVSCGCRMYHLQKAAKMVWTKQTQPGWSRVIQKVS